MELLVAVTAVFAVFAGSFAWTITPVGAVKLFLLAFVIYVPHELAHKFVAEYYGFPARFKINPMFLALTLISAIPYMPLKFIVPGAVQVYVYSGYSKSIDGKISAAGPLVSVALGFVALLAELRWLAMFSGWISLFNLLPFGPLDGRKVLSWSPPVWAFLIGCSLFLLFLS